MDDTMEKMMSTIQALTYQWLVLWYSAVRVEGDLK